MHLPTVQVLSTPCSPISLGTASNQGNTFATHLTPGQSDWLRLHGYPSLAFWALACTQEELQISSKTCLTGVEQTVKTQREGGRLCRHLRAEPSLPCPVPPAASLDPLHHLPFVNIYNMLSIYSPNYNERGSLSCPLLLLCCPAALFFQRAASKSVKFAESLLMQAEAAIG